MDKDAEAGVDGHGCSVLLKADVSRSTVRMNKDYSIGCVVRVIIIESGTTKKIYIRHCTKRNSRA